MRNIILPLLFGVVVSGCVRAAPTPKVVGSVGEGALAADSAVVLPLRLCLDVQVDNMRRMRGGERGLVRSRAAAHELGRRLGVPDPVTDGCAEGPPEPRSLRGVRWAVAARLTTRVVCPPAAAGSFHWRDAVTDDTVEDACTEDHVELSVSVFDESGAATRMASVEVEATDAAPARVRQLLATLHIDPRGSVSLPGECTETDGRLDCTRPLSSRLTGHPSP